MSNRKKEVAVYGGSFDPIHAAHIKLIERVLECGGVDEVWIVPCGPRPDKGSLVATARQRFLMCHLAVEEHFSHTDRVLVLDDDIDNQTALPTLELARLLRNRFPQHNFIFLIGIDLVSSLHKWYKYNELVNECHFLIHPRVGYYLQKLPDHRIHGRVMSPPFQAEEAKDLSFNALHTEVSSSRIRDLARRAARTPNPQATARMLLHFFLPSSVLSLFVDIISTSTPPRKRSNTKNK